jgi:hypothetical protein
MKHKHYDMIVAWANGQQIQIRETGGDWEDIESPSWINGCQYRIKLEPKPDRWSDIKVSFDVQKDTLNIGVGESVRIHFDGETGKLKSAEVL